MEMDATASLKLGATGSLRTGLLGSYGEKLHGMVRNASMPTAIVRKRSLSGMESGTLVDFNRAVSCGSTEFHIFNKESPLLDLAHIAQPGVSQRVMRHGSMSMSVHNIEDAFDDGDGHEEDEVAEVIGGATASLLLATTAACMPAMQYGFNLASMNTAAPAMRVDLGIPKSGADIQANNFIWSLCVSALPLAGMFGCKFGAMLADKLGRKKGLLILNLLFVIGAGLQAGSRLLVEDGQTGWNAGVDLFIFGRLICGLAGGGTTVVVPMYIGEIAPPHLRGALGAVFQTAQVLYMLITQVAGLPSIMGSSRYWQSYILLLEIVPGVLMFTLLPFLVESPYWASEKLVNGQEKVYQILMKLRGYDINDYELVEEAESMPHPGDRKAGSKDAVGFKKAWVDPAARQGLIIAIIIGASQQLSGINNVFNFSTQVMEDNHMSEDTITIIAIAMNVGNVINSVLASSLMDRAGRRPLLLGSALGMALNGAVLSFGLVAQQSLLIVVSTVGFVMSFGIGMGPLPWLLPCELFSNKFSSFGVSTAATANWLANFVVAMTFETIADALGGLCFVPNVLLLTAFSFWAWRSVPETRGKTIDKILQELQGESAQNGHKKKLSFEA